MSKYQVLIKNIYSQVVNAGILDKLTDSWTGELKGSDGSLQPPSLKIIDVNVYGALYSEPEHLSLLVLF